MQIQYTRCNSDQKKNNEKYQCECKSYRKCKKDYSQNLSGCVYENIKYLKSIAHTSLIVFDEIISVMDIVLTEKTNTIATNVSISCDSENVRHKINSYILHTVYQ